MAGNSRYYRAPVFEQDGRLCPGIDRGAGAGMEAYPLNSFCRCQSVNPLRTNCLVIIGPADGRGKPRGWAELSEQEYATGFEANEGRQPEQWER